MNLDIRTIVLLIGVVFALQSIPLMLLYLLANQYKGINYWLIANLLLAAGHFLSALQDAILDFFSITMANASVIAGLSLFGIGISRFTEQAYPRYFIFALNASCFVINLHFTYIYNELNFRIVNLGCIAVILYIFSAYQLVTYENKQLIISTRFTAFIFLCSGSISLLRLIAALSHKLPNTLLGNSPFQTMIFICYLMSSMLLTVGFISMFSQRLYQDLHTLAAYDFLTDTLNRRAMQLEIDKEISRCHRENGKIALILMDIDRFKSINDNYGHDNGDIVLKHFSQTIKYKIRQEDLLCRWGGEEFLVVSRVNSLEDALALAERLRTAIENEKIIQDNTIIQYTISLGVAVYNIHGTTTQQLIKVADRGLYQAKNSGRNQVAIAKIAS